MCVKIHFTENEKKGCCPESNYKYSIVNINNFKVGIVIDNNKGAFMSVTNNIENIAQELEVEHLIYKDSDGIFDYWGKDIGFRSLASQGHDTTQLMQALNFATNSYLKA
jgi:hypothetical protein